MRSRSRRGSDPALIDQAGAWRRAACRRRGAPPLVVSAPLPAFFLSFRWRPSRAALAVLAPLLASAAVDCSDGILGSDPTTGLEVEVVRGPIEPVEVPGRDDTAPVRDAIVQVRRAGGGEARARTDREGRARLLLEPGAYTVEVRRCPGALLLPGAAETTVEEGRFSAVRLECDTGIR